MESELGDDDVIDSENNYLFCLANYFILFYFKCK